MARTDMYRKLAWTGGDPRQVAEIVNNLVEGKSNNTGDITLATGGATTTTINDERIGYNSYIGLEPITMVAATGYYPYLAVQDNTDQSAASITSAYAVTFNTTDYSLGASLSNSSRLNVSYSGLYNLQFSIQFANDDSQIQDVDGSNSKFSIDSKHGSVRGHLIAALNFYLELAKNDYVEIMWATSSTLVTVEHLAAQTNPTRPATPSAIATLQYLSANSFTTNLFTIPYISSQSQGQATISHPANTLANMTYRYIIVG